MKSSLYTKVSIIAILVASLGGGLSGYLFYHESISALQKSIDANQTLLAQQFGDKIDRYLNERQEDIQNFSTKVVARNVLNSNTAADSGSLNSLNSSLEESQNIDKDWSELSVFYPSGKLIASTDAVQTGLIEQTPELAKIFNQAAAGKPANSGLIKVGNNQPTIYFMTPIVSSGSDSRVIGVINGRLNWSQALLNLQTLNGSKAYLLSDQGSFLGSNNASDNKQILQRSYVQTEAFKQAQLGSPTKLLPGLDNPRSSFVTSYAKDPGSGTYKSNGWIIIIATPKAIAFAPSRNLAITLLKILIVIMTFCLLAFMLIVRTRVIRPIRELKNVVGRLSNEDFSLRPTYTAKDEIGDLASGLDAMADKLQMAYNELNKSKKTALNEKQTFETLVNNLPVGVLMVEAPTGKTILMNPLGELLLGRHAGSNIHDGNYGHQFDLLKEDGTNYPENELPLSITLKTGQTVIKDDLVSRKPDGTMIALRVITTPIIYSDGTTHTAVCVFEDISKERNLERTRDEFFSIASHELRTPLTAIRGNTSMIKDHYWEQLPDDIVREMISDVHESSTRLIDIVNDFLDVSRLEQKRMKFEFENVDVIDIAKDTIKEYQVTSSRRKIHLEVHRPDQTLPKAYADKNRVKQVLINLVGNSLKFTDQGIVSISFQAGKDFVKIFVTDTGNGISEEAQKLLFHKFEQTSATVITRDSVRGTGLGLYISKLITEQMGGRIKLESSRPGVGTTFSFTLPIASGMQSHVTADK